MKQPLIELTLFSEKRKELLLLLKEEPKSIDEIKKKLNVDSASIQPHIKKIKSSFLVLEEKGVLRLSDIGEIIVENMQGLVDTLEVVEGNIDYWTEHDLTAIPENLLERIEELGKYEILEPDAEHMFETPDFFLENILKSKEVLTFVSYFHPESPTLYADIAENGAELTLCMTEIVAERLFQDFPEEAARLSKPENSKIFICQKPVKLPSLVVTDRFMVLKLLENTGKLRDCMLLCCEEKALQWGKELFMHYRDMSEPLDEKGFFTVIHG
ncbi:winged helix-turn-helix domain-containing protein [Methanosarcina sp. KYL-1]|uniref:helix-turn-helix transcriptional regulator n=1 Tax=Methanosarcina sp. KYL-1 TaxID=2602068 RepID=UPI002101AE91|nr:winged helix-turn-helix domain-containing protein [Methanosarcina sp. KYL-1]MCQ1535696.1 winged helix-turn-helix domain-containing protein [Methanosarcina sp. KYL-1]